MIRRKNKLKKHPPRTERYCLSCKCMRPFKYNPNICHSECVVCGCRAAMRFPPEVPNAG